MESIFLFYYHYLQKSGRNERIVERDEKYIIKGWEHIINSEIEKEQCNGSVNPNAWNKNV